MVLGLELLCALAGGALGWYLPSLARRLSLRWELFEQLPVPAGQPPVWHHLGLAAGVAAASAGAGAAFGLTWQLPIGLGVLAWLALIAAVDLQTHLIPNRLTYPAVLLTPLFAFWWSGASPSSHVLGGLLGAGFFGLAFLLNRQGIGLGDVKLALVLGLYLGWSSTLVALAATVCLGGLIAVGALLAGRSRKSAIPYGPMLAAGGAVALLAGEPLWRAYLGLSSLG